MAKVVVLLSPTQRTKLLQIPENFSEREITRYYSLSGEDLAVIEQHRRPQNRFARYDSDTHRYRAGDARPHHESALQTGAEKQLAQFEQRGKAINEKVRLYADMGNALIKAKEEAADPYQSLEAVLPWETFVSSVQEASTLARPADFDYLDLLDDH